MKKYLFLIVAVLSFLSCQKPQNNKEEEESVPFTPIVLTKAEEGINAGANDFGLDMYRALAKGDESLMISPLSISLALSLTSYGAKGNTLEQMLSTMGFKDFSSDEVGSYYKKMVEALLKADNKTTLEIANAIWADKRISLEQSFVDGAKKYYDSEVNNVDFASGNVAAQINTWCSKKTHGMINNPADNLDPSTIMALVNALYFKGKWRSEFNEAQKGPFYSIDGKETSQNMMDNKAEYPYTETGRYRMVSLPYGNGAFVMDIILPVESGKKAFEEAVANLNWNTYSKLVSSACSREVNVRMPVFKLDYQNDLKDLLPELGMKDAFTGASDFSGISKTPMCISQVIHQTAIEVTEKGTEAAAVTIIGMKLTSVGPGPEPVVFIADRPFIFAIREKSTNAILFIGQKTK